MFGLLCNTYCVTSVVARDADTREHHRKRFNRGGIDCAPKAANDEGARPIAILANMYAAYAKTVRGNRRHAKAGGPAVEPRQFSFTENLDSEVLVMRSTKDRV